MRRKKNIILNLRNTTSHFTGKAKIITLVLAIIMLSFTNVTSCFLNSSNVSALSYQGNVGLSFTFNPTLSVNISPSNLNIDNLTPGTTSDSSTINVSVATNAAYGYTLSAITNSNNGSLTHTNGANVFSSIATDASLTNLTTDNTWGYSYKNNLAPTPTWSNYSGLSNSISKVLFNTDSNSSSSIDFKIAAKASETQPSGTYTGTINFTATTKPMPKTIDDIAYMQTFAELDTVDLASVKSSMTLNSAYILKDIRDEKEYYVTRLEDGNVWMTQNLDLDLDPSKPLTSENTDLTDHSLTGAYANSYNYDVNTDTITWTPSTKTINFQDATVAGWSNTPTRPCSASKTDSTETGHTSLGNYYNWTAAIASNEASSLTRSTYNNISENPKNSICPKGWRLPTISDQSETLAGSTNEFARLNYLYNNNSINNDERLAIAPVNFSKAGYIDGSIMYGISTSGLYWSNTNESSDTAYYLNLYSIGVLTAGHNGGGKRYGISVRCLAR